MGKYLITGRQGTGKTTVIRALQERGFAAYNTDELSEVTKLQDKETGEVISWPDGEVDWVKYAWNWQEQALKNLLESNATVFVGAVVSNQESFYPLFDEVFALTIDTETLRQRLETHEHDNHRLPEEIERLVANHPNKQELFIKKGATPISGLGTVSEIVDDILGKVRLS